MKHGTEDYNFQTAIGNHFITPSLAQQYNYMDNKTHFSFVVPFNAADVSVEVYFKAESLVNLNRLYFKLLSLSFQAIEESSIRCRLDVFLSNPETNAKIKDFSVSCNFPATLTGLSRFLWCL